MSATATTPKPGRIVYPTVCPIHKISYGRELVPSTPEHESYLIGNCPQCEPRLRREQEWDSERPARIERLKQKAILTAADEAQCEEQARLWLSEDVQRLVDKYCAENWGRYKDTARENRQTEIVDGLLVEEYDKFFKEE